jgi:hypothetical protein
MVAVYIAQSARAAPCAARADGCAVAQIPRRPSTSARLLLLTFDFCRAYSRAEVDQMGGTFNQAVAQREKERAAKVGMFLQLINDPDIAPYVAMLRNGNGNSSAPKHKAAPTKTKRFAPPVGFKTGNGIRETITTLSLPHQVTVDDVLNGLVAANFKFTGHDLKHTIRDAMAALCKGKNPVFKWVGGGQGGRPKIYERL